MCACGYRSILEWDDVIPPLGTALTAESSYKSPDVCAIIIHPPTKYYTTSLIHYEMVHTALPPGVYHIKNSDKKVTASSATGNLYLDSGATTKVSYNNLK
jgi:hypothetical protein